MRTVHTDPTPPPRRQEPPAGMTPFFRRAEVGVALASSTPEMPSLFGNLRRRIQCAIRTSFMHELEFRSGQCRYCGQEWDKLYPPTRDRQPSHPDSSRTDLPGRPAPRTGVIGAVRAAWDRVVNGRAA